MVMKRGPGRPKKVVAEAPAVAPRPEPAGGMRVKIVRGYFPEDYRGKVKPGEEVSLPEAEARMVIARGVGVAL